MLCLYSSIILSQLSSILWNQDDKFINFWISVFAVFSFIHIYSNFFKILSWIPLQALLLISILVSFCQYIKLNKFFVLGLEYDFFICSFIW